MQQQQAKDLITKVIWHAHRNFFCWTAFHRLGNRDTWQLVEQFLISLSHRDLTKVPSITIFPMTSYQGKYFHFYSGPPCIYSPWVSAVYICFLVGKQSCLISAEIFGRMSRNHVVQFHNNALKLFTVEIKKIVILAKFKKAHSFCISAAFD